MWLLIRWTGTWAPLLQYCNAWTHFSSNKIQRNCMGPKITTYMPSWGQILDKRYKNTKKLNCHLKKKKSGGKAGVRTKAWALHTPPPKGWTHTSATPPTQLLGTPLPSPHRNSQLPFWKTSKQGKLLFVFTPPPCCHRGPTKVLPEFLGLASDQLLLIKNVKYPGQWGFPGGSDGKESACNVGDLGSIPGSGRFPWRRK